MEFKNLYNALLEYEKNETITKDKLFEYIKNIMSKILGCNNYDVENIKLMRENFGFTGFYKNTKFKVNFYATIKQAEFNINNISLYFNI